jgi:AraC family transcriptional regulator
VHVNRGSLVAGGRRFLDALRRTTLHIRRILNAGACHFLRIKAPRASSFGRAEASPEKREDLVHRFLRGADILAVRQASVIPAGEICGVEGFIVDYAGDLHQELHRHDHASVTLVLRGRLVEHLPSHSPTASPLMTVTKAPGTAHRSAYGPEGCRTLQLNFSREFDCGLDMLGRIAADQCVWEGASSVARLLRLLGSTSFTHSVHREERDFLLYELMVELINDRASAIAPAWLVRTKDAIDSTSPMRRWSISDLGREAGVHCVHLTKMFRRHYGCSIRDYLKLRRVRAAAAEVASDHHSLTAIAHEFGFADQAHFCRAFRSVAQLSATEYRRLVRAHA